MILILEVSREAGVGIGWLSTPHVCSRMEHLGRREARPAGAAGAAVESHPGNRPGRRSPKHRKGQRALGTRGIEHPCDGRQVPEWDAPAETAPPPVFVDDTGRRRRRGQRVGRVVGACFLSYVLLLGASLARAPWVPRVTLPGVGSLLAPDDPVPPRLGPDALSSPLPELRPAAAPATGGRSLRSSPTTTSGANPPTTAKTAGVKPEPTTSTTSNEPAASTTTTSTPPAQPDQTTTTTGAKPGGKTTDTTTPATTADGSPKEDQPGGDGSPQLSGPPAGRGWSTGRGQGPPGGVPPGQAGKSTRSSDGSSTATTTTTTKPHGRA